MTDKFYATMDISEVESGHIAEDACIFEFDSEAEMRDYLISAFELNDGETVAIVEGQFGDCWMKTRHEPDDELVAPFGVDGVMIREPGNHPGGNVYWCTPCATVYIAEVS